MTLPKGGYLMKEIVIRDNEAGQRFDKFLRKYLPQMPLSAIYKSIRKRDITINGAKASEKYMLQSGDIVAFKMEVDSIKKEKSMDFLNVEYDFKTAFEDENIVVVQKLPGQLVHPDEGNQLTMTEQVMAYLYDKGEYNPNEEKIFSPSPCNRLDRNTEGLVVFAKNYETLKEMNEGIKNGTVKKYYSTIVNGKLKDGVYTAYVVKNQSSNRVSVSDNRTAGSKEIITGITTEETTGQFSLLEIELITGRSHQIRAHLSHMGNPIVGDPKYGDKKMNSIFRDRFGLEGQLLIAYKLQLGGFFGKLSYLNGKTITMPLPTLFKKIKNDVFKF
jgi:23S rRNA pseudouridine955/2504/2580 synthase